MRRRTLLGLGLVGGTLLALVGGGAAWLYRPAWRDGQLLAPGRRVLAAVARAVLDGSLPADTSSRDAVLEQHLIRMAQTLRVLPPHSQREVAQLLALLDTAPGRAALAGLHTDWPEASVGELQAMLRALRASSALLRRQAYAALRDLTHAAYYADPSTWVLLGYPGPRSLS